MTAQAQQNGKKVTAFAAIVAAAVVIIDIAENQARRPLVNGSFKGHHWLKELLASMLVHVLCISMIKPTASVQ